MTIQEGRQEQNKKTQSKYELCQKNQGNKMQDENSNTGKTKIIRTSKNTRPAKARQKAGQVATK